MTTRSTHLECTVRAAHWAPSSQASSPPAPSTPSSKTPPETRTPSGLIEGNGHQVLNQLGGVAIAWVISIVGTLVLLFLVDKTIGLRVSAADEVEGLDLTLHGEEGYERAS